MSSKITEESCQQLQLPNIAGLSVTCASSSETCVQAALLHHPSIIEDQQVVVQLLQASKELQAAVRQQGAGQLPLLQQPRKLQQVKSLVQWLQKYGDLVCGLDVDLARLHLDPHGMCCNLCSSLGGSERHRDCYGTATAKSTLGTGVQRAIAAGVLHLQSFSLAGSTVGPSLLLQLSAGHLTQLDVEVDTYSSHSMCAVAALTGLRDLKLICRPEKDQQSEQPSANLQLLQQLRQLTQLHIGPVVPAQLRCLQQLLPTLQRLQITAHACNKLQVEEMAQWLQQHAAAVNSLRVEGYECALYTRDGTAAVQKLVAAMRAAAPTPQAAAHSRATAAAAPADLAMAGPNRLQSLSAYLALPEVLVMPLLQMLPASSLADITHLQGQHSWGDPAQVRALCKLAGLRSCVLRDPAWLAGQPWQHALGGQLVQLPALQQLTRLQLGSVHVGKAQLQQLQLPQLEVLQVQISDRPKGQLLKLSHLAALRKLFITDAVPLLAGDQLPPNLRELAWQAPGLFDVAIEGSGFSLRSLLGLSRLESLQLRTAGAAAPAPAAGIPVQAAFGNDLDTGFGLASRDPVFHQELFDATTPSSSSAVPSCVLPLKSLTVCKLDVSAHVLQQLSAFQGITCLSLTDVYVPYSEGKAVPRLAAAVQQLAGLQHLALSGVLSVLKDTGWRDCTSLERGEPSRSSRVSDGVADITALLRAIGGLQQLRDVFVHWRLPVRLQSQAVCQLSGTLRQLMPSSLVPSCKVHAEMLSICKQE